MKLADTVYAVDIEDIWPLAYKDNPQFQTLGGIVSFFLPKFLLLGGIVFFILIIIGGIGIISGAGSDDAHATEGRKKFLTNAVIGFIIMFGAYWILQIINFVTGGALKDILGP